MDFIEIKEMSVGHSEGDLWCTGVVAGSIGGRIVFKNVSKKVIKYAMFDAFLVDAFGKELPFSGGKIPPNETHFTGPLEPGEIGYAFTPHLWGRDIGAYDARDVAFEYVEIEFLDGSKVTLQPNEDGTLGFSEEEEMKHKALFDQLTEDYESKDDMELKALIATIKAKFPYSYAEKFLEDAYDLLEEREEAAAKVKFEEIIKGYKTKSAEELRELIEAVEDDFPYDFADDFLENANQLLTEKEETEAREKFEAEILGYESKSSSELNNLINRVKKTYKYSFADEFVVIAKKLSEEKLKAEQIAELDGLCVGIESMDLNEAEALEKKVKSYPSTINERYLGQINERKEIIFAEYKTEISALMIGYETLNISESEELIVKIGKYPANITVQEKKNLMAHIIMLQDKKWEDKCKVLGAVDVGEVKKLLNELRSEKIESTVKDKYENIINSEIDRLDIKELEQISDGVDFKKFYEADEVLKAIADYDAKDEIKKAYSDKVYNAVIESYKRLYEDVLAKVDKVYRERVNTDEDFIPYGKLTGAETGVRNDILNKACDYNYWEFSILTHYKEKLFSTSGYVLTAERFYYLEGGVVKTIDVSEIKSFVGVKKFLGTTLTVMMNNGAQLAIPQKHGKNIESIAYVLTDACFNINQLKKDCIYPEIRGRKIQ